MGQLRTANKRRNRAAFSLHAHKTAPATVAAPAPAADGVETASTAS